MSILLYRVSKRKVLKLEKRTSNTREITDRDVRSESRP